MKDESTDADWNDAESLLASTLESLDLVAAHADGSITESQRRDVLHALIADAKADFVAIGTGLRTALGGDESGDEAKALGPNVVPLFASSSASDGLIATWRDKFGKSVRRLFLASALALSGPDLSDADMADADAQVAVQSKLLDRFAKQLRSGEQPPDGTLASRMGMYADTAWSAAMVVQAGAFGRGGYDECRRVLGETSRHCSVCPEEAAKGWIPIDELVAIGDSPCQGSCRCHVEYRRAGKSAHVSGSRSSMNRPHRDTAAGMAMLSALDPSVPWMIRPDALANLRRAVKVGAIFRPAQEEGGDSAYRPRPMANSPSNVSGVAVIPVYGPIFRHENYADMAMAEIFGGTSLPSLTDAFRKAMGDPAVKGILFTIDSPGGTVSGVADFAREIRAGASIKPVAAYAEHSCCSAAYYLAAACGEITAAPDAMIGSIGVVFPILDDSELMQAMGLKDVSVISSQSPNKWADPSTPDGRAYWQETADSIGGRFVADVAEYRGVPVATVLSDFGRGWMKVGQEAKSAGMVDRVGTFADALSKLSGGNRARLAKASPAKAGTNHPQSPAPRARLILNPETGHGRIVRGK